jgi:hypothetical protein
VIILVPEIKHVIGHVGNGNMKITELLAENKDTKADTVQKNSDELATIQSNVHGTESGYGKAKTDKPNYAGAIGPMQILPSTFGWMQKTGIIPKDYDIQNPEQNKAAGDALLAHYYKKYDGDPSKVYAAYYGGPGAVNKDGTINTHWRDRKNPKAPTVGEYIAIAMAKSGTSQPRSRDGKTDVSLPKSVAVASAPTAKSVLDTDNVSRTISDIGSSIGNFYDRVRSDLTRNISSTDNIENNEIVLLIGGKKRKFKNKKEAEMAIKLAMQSGEEIVNV